MATKPAQTQGFQEEDIHGPQKQDLVGVQEAGHRTGCRSGHEERKEDGRVHRIYEVSQNLEILEAVEVQMKQIEVELRERYGDVKPVGLMQSIPGIGFLTALTLYAEICDIRRFSNPDKLAHYAGLVHRVKQTADHTRLGRETRANRWLKWALIEAAWSHINWYPNGRLTKVFRDACRRKREKCKAIKIVARKLVNMVWAVWTYGKEFTMNPDEV